MEPAARSMKPVRRRARNVQRSDVKETTMTNGRHSNSGQRTNMPRQALNDWTSQAVQQGAWA